MADEQPTVEAGLTFGEDLRKEREIRGISLREISDATKISRRFLEAIEKNDFAALPAPVFTRGFIREYARYLGLNGDDLINRYTHYLGQTVTEASDQPQPLQSNPIPEPPKPRPPRKRGLPPPYAGVNRNLVWIVLILIPIVAFIWFAQTRNFFRGTETDDVTSAPAPGVAAETATQPPAPAPPPPAPAWERPELSLVVKAAEKTWMTISGDGSSVFNGELEAGEERTFTAKDRFTFGTIGNAGGVSMAVNGVQLPSLGASGDVVRNHTVDRQAVRAAAESGR